MQLFAGSSSLLKAAFFQQATFAGDPGSNPRLGRPPGEGNGNPLQCSCLENPGDSGAWWAAVYGVAQSRTRLKQLSSSSSSMGFPGGSSVKHLPTMGELQEMWVRSLGQEDPLEKEMATHLSTLAWISPQTEEPGRL